MSSPPHDVHDEHHEDVNAMDDDLGIEDHGFINMQEFGFLVTRMVDLEKQVATINESLSTTNNLLNQLVCSHTLGVPFVPTDLVGADVPPLPVAPLHDAEVFATSSS